MSDKLDVQWVDIDSITPYENNPRHNAEAIEKVAASIREFGWQQPIVVDEHNVVVVGHTRLAAAYTLGETSVPVHVATELTPEQIKAYRLADNKTNEFAEWDIGRLSDELNELRDTPIDMSEFGFDINIINPEDIFTDEEPVPPTPKPAKMHTCPYCKRTFTEEQEASGITPDNDKNDEEYGD